MRSLLIMYLTSLLRMYLLSPSIYAGLLFMAGAMGFVGANAAGIPLPSWFSITYLLFSFSIIGGVARSILIGSGAFNYLTRHAGINPVKLTLVLVLASMITQIMLSPFFMVLLVIIYHVFNGITPIINASLIIPAIILSSLFTSTLGVAIGLLLVGRITIAKLVNSIPLLVLCIYLISFITPASIRIYNPITSIMILLRTSLAAKEVTNSAALTVGSATLNLLASIAVIVASSAILLTLAIISMRKLREINIYDVLMSI